MQIQIKTLNPNRNRRSGFTLIEMIGVLAVIAILAALLIPKIFSAINSARVNNAAVACSTMKTAIADHYAKWNSFIVDGSSGTAVAMPAGAGNALQFDQVLMQEQFIDKPFIVKIGDGATGATGTRVQVVNATTAGTLVTGGNSAYNLDGTGTANDATGSVVVEAVITGVAPDDAKDLNDRIDGTMLGAATGVADILGRVKFDAPVSGTTTVHVYLTHR